MIYNNKYISEDYPVFEHKSLKILETSGIGFYKFRKEIEVVLKVLADRFDNKTNYAFDINTATGCNVNLAKEVVFNVFYNYEEYPVAGEFDSESAEDNYDDIDKKFDRVDIYIHLPKSPDSKFNESLYRETVSHELNHLNDDFMLRKYTETSLYKKYDDFLIDVPQVMRGVDMNNGFAILIYRLFIDTEFNAFGAQMYADMRSEDDGSMVRSNASQDIKKTNTYSEYKRISDVYVNQVKNNPMFVPYVMKYFNWWRNLVKDNPGNKKKIQLNFKNWFMRHTEYRLKTIFNRICKSAGQYYSDIENEPQYRYEDIVKSAESVKVSLNESLGTEISFNNEQINVFCVVDKRDVEIVSVDFNPVILHFS